MFPVWCNHFWASEDRVTERRIGGQLLKTLTQSFIPIVVDPPKNAVDQLP